ncbi:MAG: ADP-dependent glucokinase [Methanosarcinaceae archaeon]|nr:ADP-dependent glucokinase [Methanosarcinaceae archaeon]
MNILCGYNANIDAINKVEGARMAKMAEAYEGEIADAMLKPPGIISSIPDFFAGLFLCMQHGTGAEWMVRDRDVFRWLRDNFLEGSFLRMGGNMGIMANVLSELGASRVVPNVANPSELQMSFFSRKAIFIPDQGDVRNKGCSGNNENDLIHFVFDFRKGNSFTFLGNDISIPRENRFIATFDPLNFELYIDDKFSIYALEHINEMDGALISGYHMLREDYPDGSGYAEKLDRSIEQLKQWKELNGRLHIHIEFGHFSSEQMAYDVFGRLFPHVDSMGMNEDELAMLVHMNGLDANGILKMDANAIIEAAISLCGTSGHGRLLVHTREFVLSVSPGGLMKPGQTLESLHFGVNCAAAFACSGKLGDRDFIMEIASKIDESEFGKLQMKRIGDTIPCEHRNTNGNTFVSKYRGHDICAVPARLCEDPVSTVGLGDTISSAIFLRELELRS